MDGARLVSSQLMLAAGSCNSPVATFGWASRKERAAAQHRGSSQLSSCCRATTSQTHRPVHPDKAERHRAPVPASKARQEVAHMT